MKRRSVCRICEGSRLEMVLDLGMMPLANRFLAEPSPPIEEPRYPLRTYFCRDCGLLQLLDIVPPEDLFLDYVYLSSTSEALGKHFAGLAADLAERQGAKAGDLVVEIASNDGPLMLAFKQLGLRPVGVEPAVNIATLAREKGLEVVNEFFSLSEAQRLRERYGPAKVVVGTNVLGHVDDALDFVRGAAALVDDDGIVCFEVPHLLELVRGKEFDTIYHEHLSYYSLHALQELFARGGLTLVDVTRVPVHGGSVRVFGRKAGGDWQVATAVGDLLAEEADEGLMDLSTFRAFAREVEAVRDKLTAFVGELKSRGLRVAGYGAAAKGNTLLNYCGMTGVLDYVVDRSPMKQGLYTPGTHIPVLPVERLTQDQPDYVLILAWNFSEEIAQQQQEYLQRGGRFIIPLPDFHVLGHAALAAKGA